MKTSSTDPQPENSARAEVDDWQTIAALAAQIAQQPGEAKIAQRRTEPPFAARESRHRWGRSLVIGAILLCLVGTLGSGVVLFHSNRTLVSPPTGANGRATVSGSTSENGRSVLLDPKAAVLSSQDLPDYKLIQSAEAARPGGATEPNSWDNLFQKSRAGTSDYRMTEAIVVVYGTAADAIAEVDQLRQAEESQGAEASPRVAAGQSTTWVEPLGINGYALVRVVFRVDNVVAQVALLGKDDPVLADEVQNLAGVQEARLQALLHESP